MKDLPLKKRAHNTATRSKTQKYKIQMLPHA